ncbi:hypothetical protein Plec18167_000556 [Paecilomyces lecythidis]|uniref:Uncharacterized protein n=1 Tax=Paecilomyces lecythidis TaxID=3004212 RepID=A0ABR3YGR9_9EURO
MHAYQGFSKSFERFLRHVKQSKYYYALYWLFFPLKAGESIQNAWVRKFGNRDPENSPGALSLRTITSRDMTFGPYILPDLQSNIVFQSLVGSGDGLISGIFHSYLETAHSGIKDFGVACESGQAIERGDTVPDMGSYDLPPTAWEGHTLPVYMLKAPLENIEGVKVCRDRERISRLSHCIGMLIFYSNGEVEAIGQIRWDQDMSEMIPVPIQVQTGCEREEYVVRDIQALSPNHDERDGWKTVPSSGTIAWWSSWCGDEILIYDDKITKL